MRSQQLLLTTAGILLLSDLAASARDRTCCRYSCRTPSTCQSLCRGSSLSCLVTNTSGNIWSEDLGSCSVVKDSKFDQAVNYKQDCLNKVYESPVSLSDQHLPLLLLAYPFLSSGTTNKFSGLDLRVRLDSLFTKLRFRIKIKNDKICPHDGDSMQEGSHCNPRCVEIERGEGPHTNLTTSPNFLSYDCEVGFYASHNTLVSTAEHEHELQVCLTVSQSEVCGQFLFLLPDPDNLGLGRVVLADMKQFEEREQILLFVPVSEPQVVGLRVVVMRVAENSSSTSEVLHTEQVEVTPNDQQAGMARVEVGQDRGERWEGRLQVSLTPLDKEGREVGLVMLSPVLTLPEQRQYALALLTAILVAVVIVGTILVLYLRWQKVAEAGAMEPLALVQAGKMEEKAVLIVTPLDNQEHVEVVKDLCKYLRDWCGLGPTYFALDDETGIGCGQRDPWKWCQETGDKVRDTGTIVFIAGPDLSLVTNSVSIHPNLEQNQAFLTTRHLKMMASEGRAVVARFSYSSLKTLPQEVPDHLKASAYHLPKQMKEFLLQLLQVEKVALCSLFPWPLVRPDIKPGDLSRPGGPELVQRVRQLTLQAAEQRGGRVDRGEGGRMVTREGEQDMGEEAEVLLVDRVGGVESDTTLQIELEAGLPSTRDMEDRDRLDTED